jgi:RND family efflux transporter MFP subunit
VIGTLDPLQSLLDRAFSELQPVAQPTPTLAQRPTPMPPGATATPIATPNTSVNDAKTAQNAVSQAQLSLSNARAYGVDQLWQAIGDYTTATINLSNAIAQFDAAISGGGDTAPASLSFQLAQGAYATASSRLTSVTDAVNSTITSMQSSLVTAQNALNNPGSRYDINLDAARADVSSALAMVNNAALSASSAKTKLTQADRSLTTVSDAITGGYLSAVNALAKVSATPKPADVISASASVTSAQATLDNALNNLANATLIAPTSGSIASVNGQVGEQVGTPTTGFIVMAATGAIALHGTIGEADVAKIKLGQVANITVDALGAGTRMTGKVTSLDPVATIQQGVPVYGADVTIDVPTAGVRPGMTGTAQIILTSKTNVLTVPNLAIRSQAGRRFVQVLIEGQAVDTDATFGIANDTLTEVTGGLKEGDLVILPQARGGATNRPGGPPGPGGGPVFR